MYNFFCFSEVSAKFVSSTSITSILKEPSELSPNHSVSPFLIYSDVTLRGENISLSFRTSQSPALLLYVNSYFREYLALLINDYGEFAENTSFFCSLQNSNSCHMILCASHNLDISSAEVWVQKQYLLQLSLNDNFAVTRVPSSLCACQLFHLYFHHSPPCRQHSSWQASNSSFLRSNMC